MPRGLAYTNRLWMERDVYRNTAIERDGGEVLIKEGFEEDYLVPLLQEGHKNRVLA